MSPYAVADGPPDLVATHAWTPAAGAAPPALNDNISPGVYPRVRIQQITGWRSLPESEDNRQPRTFGEGEIVYPSLKLGKTITYECRVEALTQQSMQAEMTACLRGFGDQSNEGTMTVTPFAGFGGGQVWTYTARVLTFEPDPRWDWVRDRREPFRWGFVLALRMSNPYFFAGGVGYL